MSRCVLVIGQRGQLARALARHPSIGGHPVRCLGRAELDATDTAALDAALHAAAPVVIVNAAAYTAVDKAESEPAAALALNAALSGALAAHAAAQGIPLIHVSTDYVFDGTGTRPYREDDPIAPLGVYGATKAEGERLIRQALPRHVILRTAWVWSEDGHNFVKTMLRLGREREEVRVVADQRGSPTYAGDLAAAIATLAAAAVTDRERLAWGTHHLTNRGETTWHGFAAAVFAEAAAVGLKTPRLTAITTADYPTPARRPAYSVLDTTAAERRLGVALPDWRTSLATAFPKVLAALP
ncbi:MAG: dTDP-4-dehydrorhamnose reductase [Hyphomicrobiaceae bacterium]